MELEYGAYIPLIIAMTEVLKVFGVEGRWSILVSVLFGVGLSLGLDFAPDAVAYAIRALMLGLAAAGFYRLSKRAGEALTDSISKR